MGRKLEELYNFLTKLFELLGSFFDKTIGKLCSDFKEVVTLALKSEKNTLVGNINIIAVFFYSIVWIILILKDKSTNESLYSFLAILLMSLFFSYENNKIKIVDKLREIK